MTRKIIFLLSVLLVSLSAEAESRIDKLLRNLHDKNSQYVFVIAHRGDWRNAPENSIQCIENAIAMGADMVELDIQQTKDNNFICMHDATLDRTSTGKGAIKNYTTTELKQFVLKSGNGIKTRRSIPTLEEALMTYKGDSSHHSKMWNGKTSDYKRKVSCRESSRGIWNQYQYALYAYHSFMERRRYKSDRKFY